MTSLVQRVFPLTVDSATLPVWRGYCRPGAWPVQHAGSGAGYWATVYPGTPSWDIPQGTLGHQYPRDTPPPGRLLPPRQNGHFWGPERHFLAKTRPEGCLFAAYFQGVGRDRPYSTQFLHRSGKKWCFMLKSPEIGCFSGKTSIFLQHLRGGPVRSRDPEQKKSQNGWIASVCPSQKDLDFTRGPRHFSSKRRLFRCFPDFRTVKSSSLTGGL